MLTAADVPHNAVVEHASGGLGELTVEQPVLASDRVRYVGEPIAVVAAVDPETAAEAADLVEVEYEDLPGVFIAGRGAGRRCAARPRRGQRPGQLASANAGTSSGASQQADIVVERTYRTQPVEHAYLETEAGVGWIENDVVTLRVSTQVIEHAAEIATILGLPHEPGPGTSPPTWAAGSAARRT